MATPSTVPAPRAPAPATPAGNATIGPRRILPPSSKPPTPEGVSSFEPTDQDLSWAQDLAEEYAKDGAHKEYRKFAESTRKQTDKDAFTFIADACNSEGGFVDGAYLDAHTREKPSPYGMTTTAVSGSVAGTPGTGSAAIGPMKFEQRKRLASYDNFAKTIRDAAWGYIVQSKDLIHRETTEPALEEFWKDADGNDSSIDDFNEEPQQESQMFGFSVVVVDRPDVEILSAADEQAPETQPYAYLVPSKNVVNWRFDANGELAAIAFLEPEEEDQAPEKAPMKVWTRACWAKFERIEGAPGGDEEDRFLMMDWGSNPIGKVPVALLFYDRPKSRRLIGKSIMRDVAILAKTVFNQDSEIREVERLCAFPFLCIPTKNPGSVKSIVLVAGGAIGYNASAGEPKYVSADLASLAALRESRMKNREAAFAMADLAVLVGYVQTTSGFHAEAEFEKTNKRLGRNAAALEDYETRLARLFLNWKGYTDEQIDDTPDLISIAYPKSFQIRDPDEMIDRVKKELDLKLGDDANQRFLRDFFSAKWPRLDKQALDALVTAAAIEITKLTAQAVMAAAPMLNPAAESKARVARMVEAHRANVESKQTTGEGKGAGVKGREETQ